MDTNILILFFLLSGCGGKSNDNKSNDSIFGLWSSECTYSLTDDEEEVWYFVDYQIDESSIETNYTYYDDENCATTYSGDLNLWSGLYSTYHQLPDVMTTTGETANWFELTIEVEGLDYLVTTEMGFYRESDILFLV